MAITITYTVTMPDLVADPKKFDRVVLKAVDETTKDVLADFEATTFGFAERSKPKWVRERARMVGDTAVGSVWTEDENYARLDKGTDDHVVGQNRQLMSFRQGYRKKTHPGVIKSRRGGPYGKRVVARGPWRVKGIEPRYFAATIALKHVNPFRKRIVAGIATLTKT